MRTPPSSVLAAALFLTACRPEAATSPAAASRAATAPAATTAAGLPIKELAVTEKGYEPARIEVEGGKPMVLRITRKTTEMCGEAVIVAGDPVSHMLPLNRPVDLQLTPPKTGELTFACGMGMMHGALVVR